MNLRLNSVNIYSTHEKLFITDGDHNLIEISGEHVPVIEQIINTLQKEENVQEIYTKVSHLIDNDESFFNEIIDWLIENRILYRDEKTSKKDIAIYFYGINNENAIGIVDTLNRSKNTRYQLVHSKELANLIVIFSPIFENYKEFLHINEFAYKKGIALFHVGIDNVSFTLGPLVIPQLKTPCLKCYSDRKLSNMKNPIATLAFAKHYSQENLNKVDITQNIYFSTAINYLVVELNKFYTYENNLYSSVLSKSLHFDNSMFEITKSQILKVPNCQICGKNNHQTALNI